jgi:AICAR transformylase/IMP cyclohydrolase PurH
MSKIALISVSDKRGVNILGEKLEALGWTLLSTGGTARSLT